MRYFLSASVAAVAIMALAAPAQAVLIGGSGSGSYAGSSHSIIAPLRDILDDFITYTGKRGHRRDAERDDDHDDDDDERHGRRGSRHGVEYDDDHDEDYRRRDHHGRHRGHRSHDVPELEWLGDSNSWRDVWSFDKTVIEIMSDLDDALEYDHDPEHDLESDYEESDHETDLDTSDGYEVVAPDALQVTRAVIGPSDWTTTVVTLTRVPEPTSLALFAGGLLCLGGIVRRRRKA